MCVQFSCSVMSNSLRPMNCSTPGLPVHHQLPEFNQSHLHWVGDAIQPSHPLSSPSPTFNLSQQKAIFPESVLRIRWPKYWSFSFSISPSNEYSGLISFRIDWVDLAVQGTLKSLLQHHSSKASVLWCSAFFIVQFSHPYRTTSKIIALTRWTLVGKVMSLVGYKFPSKEQASFNFMVAVTIYSDFGAPQNKVWHCFHCFPIYFPCSDGTGCHDLRFLNVEL